MHFNSSVLAHQNDLFFQFSSLILILFSTTFQEIIRETGALKVLENSLNPLSASVALI